MSVQGMIDAPLDLFGGLVTDIAAPDLPPGVSPGCQDCKFAPGVVSTRPGLLSKAVFSSNPTINYLKTYINSALAESTLALDSSGNLYREIVSSGAWNTVSSAMLPGDLAASDTLFGREYIAFSDGKFGIDIPRQYDGTNFDRISQVGPGAGPASVSDLSVSITSLSRTSGVITATTSAPHGLIAGQTATISGASDSTFNGTWSVVTVPNSTTFTMWQNYIAIGIQSIIRSSGTVTLTLVSPANTSVFAVGSPVIVQNVADSSYDGIFTIVTVSGSQITYAQAGTNGFSSSGLATVQAFTLTAASMLVTSGTAGSENEIDTLFNSFTPPPMGVSPAPYTIPGQTLTISGASGPQAPLNGTWPVKSCQIGNGFQYIALSAPGIITANPVVTIDMGLPDATATASGTIGQGGSITAGVHQVVVIFKTRQGYYTAPSPPVIWNASGNLRATISGIPTGPDNVIARILAFTATGGDTFFYTSGLDNTPDMVIADNTTTSIVLDFSDTELLAGTPVASLFDLVELGEVAGVMGYSERLAVWGERNKVSNFLNLTFDGGFNGNVPLGWFTDPSTPPASLNRGTSPIFGNSVVMIGDGVSSQIGKISQTAYLDSFGQPILLPSTSYSVRVRARKQASQPQSPSAINIVLFSSTGIGFIFAIPASSMTTTMQEFIGVLGTLPTTVPSDLILSCYGVGPVTANTSFEIDNIEVFPTNQPYNGSTVRFSNPADGESFDGVSGFLNVAEDNGQAVRAAFKLRNFIYFVKEHSMYVTQDNGGTPSTWTVGEVSSKVGTPSVQGAAVGEDWAVIADRSGLYLFAGGEPEKISQEIQPQWNTINWDYGQTLWVRVDTVNKRILCGVPVNGATSPNVIFVCDYRGLVSASQIIETPPVHFSSYSGKMIAMGLGRKWCPWTIVASSCGFIERSDGTTQVFIGNGAGNGKIYQLSDTQLSDDGAAIDSFYRTYFFLSHVEEQQYQTRSHRKLFGYLSEYVEGQGTLAQTAYLDNSSNGVALASVQLADPGTAAVITSIARINNLVTVTFAAGQNFFAGQMLTIASVGGLQNSFNGTFAISAVVSPVVIQYVQPGPEQTVRGSGTATPVARDYEQMTDLHAERVSFQFGTNAPGSWFSMQRFIPSLKPDPWAPVRGI